LKHSTELLSYINFAVSVQRTTWQLF